MSSLKEEIQTLRSEGKSYSEIEESLSCSKGTIAYHCSESVKARYAERQRARRLGVPVVPLVKKATHREVEQEKSGSKVDTVNPLTNCEYCRTPLSKQQSDRGGKYCSNSCDVNHYNDRRYEQWLSGTIIVNQSKSLRKLLSKLQGYACSVCGISEWACKPITLEVEHKDGNSENNSISNLCLICPNCHSQTPTYKARNRGNGRHFRRVRYAQGKSY